MLDMSIPLLLVNSIISQDFVYEKKNFYTNLPAYRRQLRNLETEDGRRFYNASVLIETRYDNYMVFKIVAFQETTDKLRDVSRLFMPGANQLITLHNSTFTLRHLAETAYRSVLKYGL